MPTTPVPAVHQLKIVLHGTKPPLWRRILVPSAASLGFLHDVIQEAFGWEGFHLHRFHDDRDREWGEPDGSGSGFRTAAFADEEEAELGKVLRAAGAVLWYTYDFGDDWRHRIEVEKITPLESGVTYPNCTGGRRAAPPAEDIGGIWGLEDLAYLVSHPAETPPEHFEDLVSHLRAKGYDPEAFDPAELSRRLSGLTVRTAVKATRTRAGTQRQVQRLTEEVPADPEVFPVITLAPRAELAARARRAPLIDDALRLAQWCAPGRQVTAKGVLRLAGARQAVEELRLGQHDDTFRMADALAGLRSAAALPVLDVPWRFASGHGLIAIRSGRAVPGPELPGRDDDDQLLPFWQEAFEDELGALDDMGARILPGMLSMLAESLDSIVFPVLQRLYRLPDPEWLGTGDVLSALGTAGGGPGAPVLGAFAIESMARLLKILADFGAADVDWGTVRWHSDHAVAGALFADVSPEWPDYRVRLTPLGRYGIRNVLVSEGHTARVAGELATADAATLLDALPYYAPGTFGTEFAGWLASRDEESAVTELLASASGTGPDLAGRRAAAITVLVMVKPDSARAILRDAAANGPDGRRHVAAGALARLGEEPPHYRETTQQWLLIDTLSVVCTGDARENLIEPVLEAIREHADDLWRSGHPATAATMDAIAAAIRDDDKMLAKRLRRSAHKARSRG